MYLKSRNKRFYGIRRFSVVMLLMLAMTMVFSTGTIFAKAPRKEKVHTIYWRAVLRRDIKKGKKVIAEAGSKVVVINRYYGNGSSVIICGDEDEKVKVPNSWLSFQKDLTTIEKEGDYSEETKEAFINKKTGVRGNEKYLIWVSLDKQRVNIFRASGKEWRLHRVYKCSTGGVHTPTRACWTTVGFKRPWFDNLKWYTEVVGGGMHKWPGRINPAIYGKHVASHGCIRLSEKDAHEAYEMIPVGTRALVY